MSIIELIQRPITGNNNRKQTNGHYIQVKKKNEFQLKRSVIYVQYEAYNT